MAGSFAVGAASLAVAVLMLGTTAHAEPPNIHTEWRTTTMSVAECIRTGERVLRATGFVNIVFNGDNKDKNVWGDRGNYSVTIECVPEKELALFVVAGPNLDQANRLLDDVLAKF